MPTIDRVDWAIRQLAMGRKVRISVGEAQDPTKMKINIFLEPAASVVASHHVCPAMAGFLCQIREWVVAYSCTDHGHKHSDGLSVVQIWIRMTHAATYPSVQLREPQDAKDETITEKANDEFLDGRSGAACHDTASTDHDITEAALFASGLGSGAAATDGEAGDHGESGSPLRSGELQVEDKGADEANKGAMTVHLDSVHGVILQCKGIITDSEHETLLARSLVLKAQYAELLAGTNVVAMDNNADAFVLDFGGLRDDVMRMVARLQSNTG